MPTALSFILRTILILLAITFSLFPPVLTLPTTDSTHLTSLSATETSNKKDTSSSFPNSASVQESNSYVCREGCRKPGFDYGYCSSCDSLTGYAYARLKCALCGLS
ncbi:hypothetical protein VTL71DRAFT_5496 [Oculimacula yallundae]|uniref:Uncharacterized protein n=1 Tax=Oculimacula yallundae TaxID=86028 RepID=A0ABR4C2U2_9HELO